MIPGTGSKKLQDLKPGDVVLGDDGKKKTVVHVQNASAKFYVVVTYKDAPTGGGHQDDSVNVILKDDHD